VNKINFKIINKPINLSELNKLVKILKLENQSSILANLSKINIDKYLGEVIKSKNLKLFVATKKGIIGYAIVAKKPDFLINDFEKLKYSFFFDLFLSMKLLILFNIVVSKFKLDSLFKKNFQKKIFLNSLNLNLLGIEKKYQSQGIGKKFLSYIFKNSGYKNKYITCETDNFRSKNFYQKKFKFKLIGKKLRFPNSMDILAKKI
tara:strand:+ start:1775 stop:2386 length:612 start_codon:yes stop_codon:yes gene_type:complete